MRTGTGVIARWLRSFTAEDLGLVSSTQVVISLLYKTPIPGDKVPSSDFCGHQVHICCTYLLTDKHTQIKK